jgi:hypothetical protein
MTQGIFWRKSGLRLKGIGIILSLRPIIDCLEDEGAVAGVCDEEDGKGLIFMGLHQHLEAVGHKEGDFIE